MINIDLSEDAIAFCMTALAVAIVLCFVTKCQVNSDNKNTIIRIEAIKAGINPVTGEPLGNIQPVEAPKEPVVNEDLTVGMIPMVM